MENTPEYLKVEGTVVTGVEKESKDTIECIVIPEGVTKISKGTFYGCLSLERVALPASLESLPPGTFFNRSILRAEFGGTKEQWLALGNNDFTSVECKDGVVGIKDIPPYFVMSSSCITGFREGVPVPSKLVIPEGVTGFSAPHLKEYREDASEEHDATEEKPCSITDITIPASMRRIGRCSWYFNELKTVHYGGTKEQWRKIKKLIGFKNGVTIHCSDGDIEIQKK